MKKIKKLPLLLSCLFLLITLSSCNTEEIGDRIETTVNDMLPNLYITLVQLALFIIMVVVFVLVAYKPLKKKLKQRQDYIEKNIKDSEKEKAEASKLLNNAKQTVFDSEQKAIEIVKNAQVTAENKINDVQKELEIKIENQKIQAHKDIEAEREKMLKEAKSEIVDAAISTSKEILGREVKVSDNDKFVDDFINEIEKK